MAGRAYAFRMKVSSVDRVDEALASDQLIIGWSQAEGLLDPSLEPDDFVRIVHETHHSDETTRRKAGQAAPQLWRFIREFEAGDLVLAVREDECYLARILPDDALYVSDKQNDDSSYRRNVEWLNEKRPIARKSLSEGLQGSLRYLRNVSIEITEFLPELNNLASVNDGEVEEDDDWTQKEIEVAVSDYRDMLDLELAGFPFNKSEHRRAVMQEIDRSNGSVEFKHQNISAVLEKIGLPWIKGYKPARNFQAALVEAVDRLIADRADKLPPPVAPAPIEDLDSVFVDPPKRIAKEKPTPQVVVRLARKVDQAERDRRNKLLGDAGERFVLDFEKRRLANSPHLAARVSWVSSERGDGLGYDIESFDENGDKIFIEVKTTRGGSRTPFFVSSNELTAATDLGAQYRLYRVYEYGAKPHIFVLRAPLADFVDLDAVQYAARLR
jgi:hypothetical protein